jgi:hypothetical protein
MGQENQLSLTESVGFSKTLFDLAAGGVDGDS